MPSSTSSSDRRFGPLPPSGPWGRTWLLAAVLCVAALGTLENWWRSHGYFGSVHTNLSLWSYQRDRVSDVGREKVALVGASRLAFGFHLDVFREECPGVEPVQLGIFATTPYATLRGLADDESFAGLALVSLDEISVVPAWEGQQDHVDFHRDRWGPGLKASLVLAAPVQASLALLQPQISGRALMNAVRNDKRPPITYIETLFDRTSISHDDKLTKADFNSQIRHRIRRTLARAGDAPLDPQRWTEVMGLYRQCVDDIRARGGEVVFVKYPLRGRFLEVNHRFTPRDRYWDRIAPLTGAETIHYQEMPDYRQLVLPDESHLDQASGVVFTRWLTRELIARGLLEPLE